MSGKTFFKTVQNDLPTLGYKILYSGREYFIDRPEIIVIADKRKSYYLTECFDDEDIAAVALNEKNMLKAYFSKIFRNNRKGALASMVYLTVFLWKDFTHPYTSASMFKKLERGIGVIVAVENAPYLGDIFSKFRVKAKQHNVGSSLCLFTVDYEAVDYLNDLGKYVSFFCEE